jgi:D-alanine--poly(phosphoribitol) ligase subunit 2
MVHMFGKRDVTLESRVQRIFAEYLDLDIDVDTEVIETGIIDSIAFVQLLFALENEFGVKVGVASLDLEDFASVARIAQFLSAATEAA